MTPEPPRLADLVIAIDGSSGSGKSSVSRRVAGILGLGCLDTGAMYRAVACAALDRGVPLSDAAAVASLATAAQLEQSTDPEHEAVVIDGVDVTAAIREPRVSAAVSEVARNLDVRAELIARQRAVAASGAVVIEGRDITTVVAPEAPVRLLLTADADARVARRARELHGAVDAAALAATRDSIVLRDAKDSAVTEFLAPAEGVVGIDTSSLAFDEVVAAVLQVVADRVPEAAARIGSLR